jgi:quinol-cytochrome oxidoreductase complex cytochrome b subunit
MKRSFRNANIGIASSVVVLIVGTILFYDNDGAMELLALFAFGVAMGVLFFLDWRDERAQRKIADRSS